MLIRKLLQLGQSQPQTPIPKQAQIPEMQANFEQQPPWDKTGWLDEVSCWIRQQLEPQGIHPTAIAIETIKKWSISCVLKIETPEQRFFFKQASPYPPLFCNEPSVTAELSQLFPDNLPTIVACDRQQQWLLLKDFGTPLGHRASLNQQEAVYEQFGQLQLQSVPYRDRLLSAGCLDRRLATLHNQIDPLLNDTPALSALSAVEVEQLRNIAPILKQACHQLSDYRIPETLVHGDFHLNNVALNRDQCIFFDWTDACISHPFLDGASLFFMGEPSNWLERSMQGYLSKRRRQIQTQLRHRYLSLWKAYESDERLQAAWEIAKPLCALHHAITYQQMLQALEPSSRPQMQEGVTLYIRRLLAELEGNL